MRYNKIIENDVTNGEGVCVSFWVQGCPHHCPDCFNPETWDFDNGELYTPHTKWEIIKAINANGITRNFSILGGEPLAPQNLPMTEEVVTAVRAAYPNIKIFLWTGYKFPNLKTTNEYIKTIIGNNGGKFNIDILNDIKNNIMNIDLMIINELNDLFMGIF